MNPRVVSHEDDTLVIEVPYAPGIGAYGVYYSERSESPSSFMLSELVKPRVRGEVATVLVAGSDLPIDRSRPFFIRMTRVFDDIETPIAQCEAIHVMPSKQTYFMDQFVVPPKTAFGQSVFDISDALGRSSDDVSIISDKQVKVKINTLSSTERIVFPEETIDVGEGDFVEKLLLSNPWDAGAFVTIMGF
jgi:hypothetical protein